MIKVKLLNRAQGIGKDSHKPWCRITLGSDLSDGSRAVGDFFVGPEVAMKVASLPLDTFVYVSADLDDRLHFSIVDVRSAETGKATAN